MLAAHKQMMREFIEQLADALLQIPVPPGEWVANIRIEKRHGDNREVAIRMNEPSPELVRTKRKSHPPVDGLELADLAFLQPLKRTVQAG